MSPAESMTAAGRAAWRRQRRLAWYLWHASRRLKTDRKRPLLLLAELDDVSDGFISDELGRHLPKFASSGGACGLKIPVPILLKGFGTTDLERWLARSASRLAQPDLPPWSERTAAGVWRGSSRMVLPEETCPAVPDFTRWEDHPRGRLVALSSRHPRLIDAGYTELEKMPGGNTTPVPLVRPLPWEGVKKYKYQVEVDGHGYQASLLAKMLVGSVVLMQQSHWPLWFADALTDGEHVVRVRSDLRDLPARIEWLRAHDDVARRIAQAGRARVQALLHPQHMIGHVAALLERYRGLFTTGGGAGGGKGGTPPDRDRPPPLATLFAELCAGGTRSCSRYNVSQPPPHFATLAGHRKRGRPSHAAPGGGSAGSAGSAPGSSGSSSGSSASATRRVACPTAHFADVRALRCDSWCRRASAREHCTWCKCGSCEFCGGRPGAREIEVPVGFTVA